MKVVLTEDQLVKLVLEADKRNAIKNSLGFNDAWAEQFHELSDKISPWIANTFVDSFIQNHGNQFPADETITTQQEKRKQAVRILNDMGPRTRFWVDDLRGKYETIMHWVRAPRREQLDLRSMSLDQAYQQAEEWHDTLQVRSAENFTETNDVFIDYRNADGIGYYWVNLHKGFCEDERERMGHCGRSNTGTLISFRRINDLREGTSLLTVDYRPGGIVGDFHRHGNKKPTSRFHPQIVDFLINTTYPVNALTKEGVYRPEDNFALSDLSEADRRRVYSANPNLRFNINDKSTWPEIIAAAISGEIDPKAYSLKTQMLLAKASEFNPAFLGAIRQSDYIYVRTFLDTSDLFRDTQEDNAAKKIFMQLYGQMIAEVINNDFDGYITRPEDFIDFLRTISLNYDSHYELFCPSIDAGFRKWEDQKMAFIGAPRIKKKLFRCTDMVESLHQYAEYRAADSKGRMAVKMDDFTGLWGLIDRNNNFVIQPDYNALQLDPTNRSGDFYMGKNSEGFFRINAETGERTKLASR